MRRVTTLKPARIAADSHGPPDSSSFGDGSSSSSPRGLQLALNLRNEFPQLCEPLSQRRQARVLLDKQTPHSASTAFYQGDRSLYAGHLSLNEVTLELEGAMVG